MRRGGALDNTTFGTLKDLTGSDDYYVDYDTQADVLRPKASFRLWWKKNKKNVVTGIITAILIPVIGFLFVWFFDQNANIRLISYRIDEAAKRIDQIETNSISKQELQYEVSLAKMEIKSFVPNLDETNLRLTYIENALNCITNESVYAFSTDGNTSSPK